MTRSIFVFSLILTACSTGGPIELPSSKEGFSDGGASFVGSELSDDGGNNPTISDSSVTADGSSTAADGSSTDAHKPEEADGGAPPVDAGSPADADAETDTEDGGDSDLRTPDGGETETDATPDDDCPGSGPGVKCEGRDRFACVSGQWVIQETCDHTCQAGACVGECDPGSTDCLNEHPRTCNSNGLWDVGLACSFVCSEGSCVGECDPGATDCQGDVPRTCNSQGQWVESSACAFVCSDGACVGVCEPGDRNCSGDTPRQCDASGQWVNEAACPFVCSEGVCSGACDPGATSCAGDTPRTCNDSGVWVNGTTCPFTCSGGSCTGVCEPGDRDCSGLTPRSCNAAGQWVNETACPFVCSGEGVCIGSCTPNDTDCQGDVPRTCNSQGQWVSGSACQFVCSDGACTGVCEPGDVQCSGSQIQTCNSQGQWGTAANCPSVAGANAYCLNDACTFDCQLDYDDCDGNPANGCEAHLETDSNNCGSCGHSCCGGACGSGTCEVYDSGLRTVSTWEVDSNSIYTTAVNGQTVTIQQTPREGGATSAMASITGDTTSPRVTDLASNGTNLFWSLREGGVLSVPLDGSGQYESWYINTIDTFTVSSNHGAYTWYNLSATGELLLDATRVYWFGTSSGFVNWKWLVTPTQTGGSFVLPDAPTHLVSDGDYIYATPHTALNPISRHNLAFDNNESFVTSTSTNYVFGRTSASDGVYLYYVYYDGPNPADGGIWKKPLNGGSATQIVADPRVQAYVATDGLNVYYISDPNTSNPVIRKVPVTGGSSAPLVTYDLPTWNSELKVVDECLYWHRSTGIKAIAVNP